MNDLCEGQPRRRLKIWRSWQFICTCERCRRWSDSGIKCAFCEDGFAFPTTPNEPGTIWRCGMCERQLEEGDIIELLRAEEKLPSPGRLHKDHFLLFKRSTYVLNEEWRSCSLMVAWIPRSRMLCSRSQPKEKVTSVKTASMSMNDLFAS